MEGQDESVPRGTGEEEPVLHSSTSRCLVARYMKADRRGLWLGRTPASRVVATPADADSGGDRDRSWVF
jgi:hypothetical protein